MEFVIITGLSGAGKSTAADVLEDFGYYCVDNMPSILMPRFAEFCLASGGKFDKVALVSDIREKGGFDDLIKAIDDLRESGCDVKVLFMSAEVKTLLKRYKETRRRHPLQKKGETLEDSIKREVQMIASLKDKSDFIIDSTNQPINVLKRSIKKIFKQEDSKEGIEVNVISFGFKYGIPLDADLVFDVRFLPNPYYVESLTSLTGMDDPVHDYVFSFSQTEDFMKKLEDMILFLLPHYEEEGKPTLNIAIGCTGGRHRSVAMASSLNDFLVKENINATLINRDIDK